MSLNDRINEDLREALKERRKEELRTLRLLHSSILNAEKEKRYKIKKENPEIEESELVEKSQLSDDELIDLLSSEVKTRREAIEDYRKGEREDLVEKEQKEIEVLQRYLPEQMTEDEIREEAGKVIEETGAEKMEEMGLVMSKLMEKVKGRADGKVVNQVVREMLSEDD